MAHVYGLAFDDSYLKFGGGVSFVACLVIFKVIGPVFSPLFVSSYSHLQSRDKNEWNERWVGYPYVFLCKIMR